MSKWKRMSFMDFIERDGEHDVYDDVCDGIGVCYCGGMKLTDEGKKEFAEILECELDVCDEESLATFLIDECKDWKRKYKVAKAFFWSAAGYCVDDDFNKWFEYID